MAQRMNDDIVTSVKRARTQVKKAERDRKDQKKKAIHSLKKANKDYNDRINSLEKELVEAEQQFSKETGFFSGIKLFGDRIVYKDTTLHMEDGIQADVVTAGSKYSITDENAKTIIHDERTLFVRLQNRKEDISVEGSPDREADARTFVSQVMNASATFGERLSARNSEVASIRAQLDAARLKTHHIEKAQNDLDAVQSDVSEINVARRRLDEIMDNATPEQRALIEQADKLRKRTKMLVVLCIILVILIAALVLILLYML